MPFAWTGIHLHSILHGASSMDRDKDKASERDTASNDGVPISGSSLGN